MAMLNWIKMLEDLTDNELMNLEIFCQKRVIKTWEVLFNERDEASSMYLIIKWRIEVFNTKDSEEKILGYIDAEWILWEMAIFWEQWKRMACAKATRDSVLLVVLSFSIKEITSKHPELLEKIKEIIEIRNIQNKNK